MGGEQARAVRRALVRGQNEDESIAEDDGVEKEEDGVVEEVVEDEVGVMLLVSMLKGLSRPA